MPYLYIPCTNYILLLAAVLPYNILMPVHFWHIMNNSCQALLFVSVAITKTVFLNIHKMSLFLFDFLPLVLSFIALNFHLDFFSFLLYSGWTLTSARHIGHVLFDLSHLSIHLVWYSWRQGRTLTSCFSSKSTKHTTHLLLSFASFDPDVTRYVCSWSISERESPFGFASPICSAKFRRVS